jgi:hypothetical protein
MVAAPSTTASQRRHPAWRRRPACINHGDTKLWTAMSPGRVIKADSDYVDKDGSIHMKFGWWRGVSG